MTPHTVDITTSSVEAWERVVALRRHLFRALEILESEIRPDQRLARECLVRIQRATHELREAVLEEATAGQSGFTASPPWRLERPSTPGVYLEAITIFPHFSPCRVIVIELFGGHLLTWREGRDRSFRGRVDALEGVAYLGPLPDPPDRVAEVNLARNRANTQEDT